MNTLAKIQEIMKVKSIKQKDITSHLGLSEDTFGAWKAGRNSSYKKYLYQIADFLGVSVDYLLGRTDDPQTKKSSAEAGDYEEIISLHYDGRVIKYKIPKEKILKFQPLLDELCNSSEDDEA